jgi:aminopeptidase-like protein
MTTTETLGRQMHELATRLYPICRSITGDGVRQTLALLQQEIPLAIHEVPTGTPIFDWTVPKEWHIRDAWIKNSRGQKVVDFSRSTLHVVNYSVPVHSVLPLEDLKAHLFTLPEHPDWIPYRTSYYQDNWGFCLPHNDLVALPEDRYEVLIDSSLEEGSLTYGEFCLSGEMSGEVLISSHICHPSLANDNLSGIAVAVFLAKALEQIRRRYSYRFLFAPGTIGAIAWLARNQEIAARVMHGLVLTCVGDRGGLTYKRSRRGTAEIDRTVELALKESGAPYAILDFSPYGYDERQYCSPGFNLPVGCLMRTPWGRFAEYHTSADNLAFIDPSQLARTLEICVTVTEILEGNRTYRNLSPFCEPQLGRRGLYGSIGGADIGMSNMAHLWALNLSDGAHSLLDIAEQAGIPFMLLRDSARLLAEHGLLEDSSVKFAHSERPPLDATTRQ